MAVQEVADYYKARTEFYQKFPEFYSDLPELEYGIYGAILMPRETVAEIKYATKELWLIMRKVKEYLLTIKKSKLIEIGYSEELVEYLNLDYLFYDTVLSRFDFIVDESGIHAMELNNVTPFLVMETFKMNNEICKNENLISANQNSKNEIMISYTRGILDCMRFLENENPKIAITSFDIWTDHEEYETVNFIKEQVSKQFEVEWIDIRELQVAKDEALYAPSGEVIDILIMPAYPYEFLIDDVSEDGRNVGIEMLDLVKQKKLALLNPPSSHLLQSKRTFAILWEWFILNDRLGYLTEHECEIIRKYLLPTYNVSMPFELSREEYVKKPVFSREGSSVELHTKNGIIKSNHSHYEDFQNIYQKYQKLPSQEIILGGEVTEKKFIIGSFVCNDEAVGLSCRLGGDITEWDSHWLAIGVEEQ